MRKFVLVSLIAFLAIPAPAATKLTVDQPKQALAASGAALSQAVLPIHQSGSAQMRDTAAEPSQLSAEEAKLLESVRSAALEYSQRLPNFICTQVTHRLVTPTGGWNALESKDDIEERVSFVDGKEDYEVVKLNGEKVRGKTHMQFQGAISTGEFGTTLHAIFDPQSRTKFSWDRGESPGGKGVDVFRFEVPKESGITVTDKKSGMKTVVPYSGEIFINIDTLEVLRIDTALKLPLTFPIFVGTSTVEYKPVTIAGRSYNLPYRSETHMQSRSNLFDNIIDFEDYHKFGSASVVYYSAPASADAPAQYDSKAADPATMEQRLAAEPRPVPAPTSQPDQTQASSVPPRVSEIASAPVVPASQPTNPVRHSVDLTLIVYRHGVLVKDLQDKDIELDDNGRKQQIGSFAPMGASVPADFQPAATIVLIDRGQLSSVDLNQVRKQIIHFLDTAPAGEQLGLYTIDGVGFQVLVEATSDHAALMEQLKKWNPSTPSSVDKPAQSSDPVSAALHIMTEVAQHLAALPGAKDLVWISSDKFFLDSMAQQAAEGQRRLLDGDALRVPEAMNAARVTVFPFILTPTSRVPLEVNLPGADATTNSASPVGPDSSADPSMRSATRPFQLLIHDLAQATGGIAMQNTCGLACVLVQTIKDRHAAYLVSFSPDGPADGQFHALTVKLGGKFSDCFARYRTRYLNQ